MEKNDRCVIAAMSIVIIVKCSDAFHIEQAIFWDNWKKVPGNPNSDKALD